MPRGGWAPSMAHRLLHSLRYRWYSRKPRKLPRDLFVDRPPKWNHQRRHTVEPFPTPRVELHLVLGALGGDVDLRFAAGKPEREPFLLLSAESHEPVWPLIRRKVVGQPILRLA